MTDKLYYEDGYLRETEATVIAVTDEGIILDRTVFYPEGGGQPGDRGTFGTFVISDTRKGPDDDPVHIIEGEKPAVGEKKVLCLDWDHRYFYMMEHSAQHLVSSILFSCHGIGTVAVHQGERFFTVETDKSEITDDVLLSVEDEAAAAIRENHRITQREMGHEEAEALGMRRSIKVDGRVKVVFIDGLDRVACGGVHLGSTGEIGEIQYCGQERIRGHVRTMWKCGPLSVDFRRQNHEIVKEASAMLSAEPETLLSSIRRLSEENQELRHSLRSAFERAASLELEAHRGEGSCAMFCTDGDISSFEGLFSENDGQEAFIIDAKGRFMFHGTKEGFDKLKSGLASYSLRGGGRGGLFRGSVQGGACDVLEEARSLLDG